MYKGCIYIFLDIFDTLSNCYRVGAAPKQHYLKGILGCLKEREERIILPSSLSHPRMVFMVSFVYHPDSIVKSLLRAIVRICSTLFLKAACSKGRFSDRCCSRAQENNQLASKAVLVSIELHKDVHQVFPRGSPLQPLCSHFS